MNRPPEIDTSLINGTYRGFFIFIFILFIYYKYYRSFMEIIFQNNDTTVQSYHLDGYAFFVVGWAINFDIVIILFLIYQIPKFIWIISHLHCSMDFGVWTENRRVTYNKCDGVARCTTQVLLSIIFTQNAFVLIIWLSNFCIGKLVGMGYAITRKAYQDQFYEKEN